jgi:phage head maturation protease
MTTYAIQGLCTEFKKCFQHGERILYLNPTCFNKSIESGEEVKLLYDHDDEAFPNRSVELYAGDKGLAFRIILPESRTDVGMSNVSDDFDTYIPVSIGYKEAQTETTMIDGVEITSVVQATLHEVSLLSKAPAVNTTYARVVDLDTCGSLEDDYDRIQLVGRYVSLHRQAKAQENGGIVEYGHTTSPYDRAANNFERALRRLNA